MFRDIGRSSFAVEVYVQSFYFKKKNYSTFSQDEKKIQHDFL